MEVLSMEVARAFAEKSLEISFASAMSTVNSGINAGEDQAFVEAALQAQLISYAGLEEIESFSGSLQESVTRELLPSPASQRRFSRRSPTMVQGNRIEDSIKINCCRAKYCWMIWLIA